MSVYIDQQQNRFHGMKMSHMLADTLVELHEMAKAIGLKREWFQPHGTPHYDVSQSKRKLAIEAGAIEVDRYRLVRILRAWRLRGGDV